MSLPPFESFTYVIHPPVEQSGMTPQHSALALPHVRELGASPRVAKRSSDFFAARRTE
jgi:hypothetical protein